MLLDLIENRLWHRDELVRAGAVEGSEDVDCEVAKDPAVVNVDLGDPGALVDLEHETCIQPPPTISQAHLQCYIGKVRQCVYIYMLLKHIGMPGLPTMAPRTLVAMRSQDVMRPIVTVPAPSRNSRNSGRDASSPAHWKRYWMAL